MALVKKTAKKIRDFLLQTKRRSYASDTEEIIHKYHAFLKTMEHLNRKRPEGTPVEDYGSDLIVDFDRNIQEINSLTNGFSDVLYGDKQLTPERLHLFRQSFDEMVKTFA